MMESRVISYVLERVKGWHGARYRLCASALIRRPVLGRLTAAKSIDIHKHLGILF